MSVHRMPHTHSYRFLGNVKIGEDLFHTYYHSRGDPPQWMETLVVNHVWSSYRFQEVVANLLNFSLLQDASSGTENCRFSLRLLIREWIKLRISESERSAYTMEAIEFMIRWTLL